MTEAASRECLDTMPLVATWKGPAKVWLLEHVAFVGDALDTTPSGSDPNLVWALIEAVSVRKGNKGVWVRYVSGSTAWFLATNVRLPD